MPRAEQKRGSSIRRRRLRRNAADVLAVVALGSFVAGAVFLLSLDFATWLDSAVSAPPIVIAATALAIRRPSDRRTFVFVAGGLLLPATIFFGVIGGLLFSPGALLLLISGAVFPKASADPVRGA